MIKLIACDVDGTLLPQGRSKPDGRIIELLGQIAKKGVKTVIASGRSLGDIKRIFFELDRVPIIIADDGAVAVENGKVIYSKPMSLSDISLLLRTYKNGGVPALFSTASGQFLMENGADRDTLALCGLDGRQKHIHELKELKEPIYKLSFFLNGRIPEKPIVPEDSRIYYKNGGWLEYIPRFADKGAALSAVQSLYFADSFDTVAIGNETNDIGMIKKARYSVCIGNNCAELAKLCSVCTDDIITVLEGIARDPSVFPLI